MILLAVLLSVYFTGVAVACVALRMSGMAFEWWMVLIALAWPLCVLIALWMRLS